MGIFEEESTLLQGKTYRDHLNRNWDNGNKALENLNSLFDKASGAQSFSPNGVFDSLTSIENEYPSGDTGIYVATDTGHWFYYDYTSNAWKDGGAYQAGAINKGYFKDGAVGNTGTTTGSIAWNGATWLQFTGDDTTDNKGVHWNLLLSDFKDIFASPIQIDFDIQSSIDQDIQLRVQYLDASSNLISSALIKDIPLKAWKYEHITALYQLDSQFNTASSIQIGLYCQQKVIGKIMVKDAISIPFYLQKDERFSSTKALFNNFYDGSTQNGVVNNTSTSASVVSYLGTKWLKISGNNSTQYKGINFTFDVDSDKEMFKDGLQLRFIIQSSISQTLAVNLIYKDSSNAVLKTQPISNLDLEKYVFKKFDFNAILNADYASSAKTLTLQIVSNGTADIGNIMMTDVSIGYNFDTNYRKSNALIDTDFSDGKLHGAVANTTDTSLALVDYISKKWVQVTGNTQTKYKGVHWPIANDSQNELIKYGLNLKFTIQSSIDQDIQLNLTYFDKTGKQLSVHTVETLSLSAYQFEDFDINAFIDQSLENLGYVGVYFVSNNAADIGKILITDLKCSYNFPKEIQLSDSHIFKSNFSDGHITVGANNVDTGLSIARYLNLNWLQITGNNSTQYKGINLHVNQNVDIFKNPLKLSLLAQSSIDQDLQLNIIFKDANGNKLGEQDVSTIKLKSWEIKEHRFVLMLNSDYANCSYLNVMLASNNSSDIGKILITNLDFDYSFSQDYVDAKNDGLPHIFLDGDMSGMSKDNSVTLKFEYVKNNHHTSGYASTKWQGDSSTVWPKKAFRIKTFSDGALQNKLNFKPTHRWDSDNKWNLKAYYTDGLLARDVANANLGAAIWASESNTPGGTIQGDNFGFIDGFPVALYLNGSFYGVYSFNTTKGDYGKTAAIVDGAVYSDVTRFKTYPTGGDTLDGTNFEMVSPDDPTDAIKTGFNAMLSFAINSSDADFTAGIDQYLDKESVIDYLIFSNLIGNTDAWGKNQTFFSYDLAKWYLHPYDLDVSFGGEYNGTLNPKPVGILGVDSVAHQLFVRFNKVFSSEIKTRYQSLRAWFTPSYVLNEYRKRIDAIGDENYQREYDKWNNPSKDTYSWAQLSDYVVNQFKICDKAWNNN